MIAIVLFTDGFNFLTYTHDYAPTLLLLCSNLLTSLLLCPNVLLLWSKICLPFPLEGC